MSTTQQAIEALDELLRDAFMYIRHNPGAGSDPLLVRLKGTKTMMDALASLPQQDVGAGRPVPSPVGQEPVAEEDVERIGKQISAEHDFYKDAIGVTNIIDIVRTSIRLYLSLKP